MVSKYYKRASRFFLGHHPTSYLTSLCTWPGLPPLFANWVVAKAWEYGYCNSASVCLWIWVYVCDLRIQDWRDSLREGDIPPLQQWIPIDWLETLFPNIYMTVLTVNYVKCTDNSSLYKHLSRKHLLRSDTSSHENAQQPHYVMWLWLGSFMWVMVIYSATTVAPFPGLPTAQFLITYSIEELMVYSLLRIRAELNFEYIMSCLQTSTECRLTPHKVFIWIYCCMLKVRWSSPIWAWGIHLRAVPSTK